MKYERIKRTVVPIYHNEFKYVIEFYKPIFICTNPDSIRPFLYPDTNYLVLCQMGNSKDTSVKNISKGLHAV